MLGQLDHYNSVERIAPRLEAVLFNKTSHSTEFEFFCVLCIVNVFHRFRAGL